MTTNEYRIVIHMPKLDTVFGDAARNIVREIEGMVQHETQHARGVTVQVTFDAEDDAEATHRALQVTRVYSMVAEVSSTDLLRDRKSVQ